MRVSLARGVQWAFGRALTPLSAKLSAVYCAPTQQGMPQHRHKSKPCVYKIACAVENKAYIGQTCWFVQRMSKHRNGDNSNRWKARLIRDAIERRGWDAMTVEKLWEGEDESQLNSMETKLIAEHGTLEPGGYNILEGGAPNRKERRERMKERGTNVLLSQPKGERPEALNAKQRATWEAKREAKWDAMGVFGAERERLRHNCAMEAANKLRKRKGLALNDPSVGPERKRKSYWDGEHGKRLTPGNLRANCATGTSNWRSILPSDEED